MNTDGECFQTPQLCCAPATGTTVPALAARIAPPPPLPVPNPPSPMSEIELDDDMHPGSQNEYSEGAEEKKCVDYNRSSISVEAAEFNSTCISGKLENKTWGQKYEE
ncbi:hypothetical protein L1987_08209 [Smallanthus sonchifolius]|uniref:Uncharacterized protein n=1 Tax=Smallanthus sonchifolius TaxID=185202 RepID=A0ACB9JLQ6_9ASTR|nr:hypothetical protein L1987_08209 [Smallanthus sonchifolius]